MALLKSYSAICGRCLIRRSLSTSSSLPLSSSVPYLPTPPPPPFTGHVRLSNRALISLTGHDASRFLQGLTTANISPSSIPSSSAPPETPPQTPAIYSAFLNAQGRILNDVFIYPVVENYSREESFLIEVDASEQDRLLRWLKRYKLRAKIVLRPVTSDEYTIWSAWDDGKPVQDESVARKLDSGTVTYPDNRVPSFGHRILVPHTSGNPDSTNQAVLGLPHDSKPSTLEQYTLRRYLHGLPEGQYELQREVALLQESCLDYMGGVDFRKGCYVGQELVIRTQHTGVVRKRVLPVVLYCGDDSESDAASAPKTLSYDYDKAKMLSDFSNRIPIGGDIIAVGSKNRRIAKWMGGVGNVGLALWRLENMDGVFKIKAGDGEGNVDKSDMMDLRVKPFVPEWWAERKAGTGSV